jgi:hypothetical protein
MIELWALHGDIADRSGVTEYSANEMCARQMLRSHLTLAFPGEPINAAFGNRLGASGLR